MLLLESFKKADSIVSELNVAQKQMIKIAEALSRNSKLLVMDEPTASLPRHERDSLFNIIKQLVADGISIIYISHYLEEIFMISNRCTVLRNGSNVLSVESNERRKDEIIKAMVGREVDNYYKDKTDYLLNEEKTIKLFLITEKISKIVKPKNNRNIYVTNSIGYRSC